MDFSKFSDPDFGVKEWVNAALRAHKDKQTPVDVSMPAIILLPATIKSIDHRFEQHKFFGQDFFFRFSHHLFCTIRHQ